jgi:hypothetical protein
MAKKDRVDSVTAHEAVPSRPMGMNAAKTSDGRSAASGEQLELLSLPPDAMVQQILERQAVFGF